MGYCLSIAILCNIINPCNQNKYYLVGDQIWCPLKYKDYYQNIYQSYITDDIVCDLRYYGNYINGTSKATSAQTLKVEKV